MAQQGKLKWYNHVKGYGFISREEGQKDLFVHVSEFRKSGIKKVKEGMIVEYELSDHNGKPVAVDIKVVHIPE
tara:strand:+ start:956 stop:1174 length:219 start_codon:yes stop_codon:yes gene_type:complete